MIYFYGGAFNPMTVTHKEIIFNLMKKMSKEDRLIIAITTHDYKKYQFPFKLREHIVIKNLLDIPITDKKVKVIEQTERTWKFLNSLTKEKITIVLGEDEYKDLKAGLWHNSTDILNTYEFIIIPRTNNISSSIAREIINSNINNPDILHYITETSLKILKSNDLTNNNI